MLLREKSLFVVRNIQNTQVRCVWKLFITFKFIILFDSVREETGKTDFCEAHLTITHLLCIAVCLWQMETLTGPAVCISQNHEPRMEVGSNTSIVTVRVVGGDEKGTLWLGV
jgi:hypothetical protein